MSEIEDRMLGLHGTELSKCSHLMTLSFKWVKWPIYWELFENSTFHDFFESRCRDDTFLQNVEAQESRPAVWCLYTGQAPLHHHGVHEIW